MFITYIFGIWQWSKKLLMWDLFQKFMDSSTDKVELFGSGYETRDFIHVVDIISQLNLVIQNAEFKGESINIGNGKEVPIHEIVHLFKESLNSNKQIEFNNLVRIGDPLNWCADISLLQSWGYLQSVELIYGVNEFIKSNF